MLTITTKETVVTAKQMGGDARETRAPMWTVRKEETPNGLRKCEHKTSRDMSKCINYQNTSGWILKQQKS